MRIIGYIILISILCTGTVWAKKPEHAGKGKKEKNQNKYQKNNKNFSSNDSSVVNSYYENLPPGLQKKMKRTGELPPGWKKKVKVGQPISKEYLSYTKPAPDELRVKLHLRSNEQLLQISNKLLKVDIRTNILLGEIDFW